MKCESCRIREAETEVLKYEDGCEETMLPDDPAWIPYKVCSECKNRLINKALRPLEYFNLVAIHGPFYFLNDDFYDEDTGEAYDPDIKVVKAKKFPYPSLKKIKDDPERLLDYAFVLYDSRNEEILNELRKFDKRELLEIIKRRIGYNIALIDKAYQIVAEVIGRDAEEWAREQWANRYHQSEFFDNEFDDYATLLVGCLDNEEAFTILTKELEQFDTEKFYDSVAALIDLKKPKTLDWLETQTDKITDVPLESHYGFLVTASGSGFDWERCERWLNAGQPLSLIALDVLFLCKRRDIEGFLYLEKVTPQLFQTVGQERIEQALRDYLLKDDSPKAKKIIDLIFQYSDKTV